MQALKVSWVGKTFALSKPNESVGKKTRIRRSKKERKEMAELFINNYQKLNNGNFPSLSLTHKEVGGSFYTVREVVREIIQENRVLGPAKPISKDELLEENPLGSISMDPHIQSPVISEEVHSFSVHMGEIEELVSIPDGLLIRPGHKILDEGEISNGSIIDLQSEEYDKKSSEALNFSEVEISVNEVGATTAAQVTEPSKLERSTHETPASVTTRVLDVTEAESKATIGEMNKDIIVEKAPLKPFSKSTGDLYRRHSESGDSSGTMEDNEIENIELRPEIGNGKLTTAVESSLGNSDLLGQKEMGKKLSSEDLPLETVDLSTNEDVIVKVPPVGADVEIKVSQADTLTHRTVEQSQLLAMTKAKSSPDGIQRSAVNGVCLDSNGTLTTQDATVTESKVHHQQSPSPLKGSNKTLNRIKPESWEGASRNIGEQENNPLLAIFKSFITAFVKFWSE